MATDQHNQAARDVLFQAIERLTTQVGESGGNLSAQIGAIQQLADAYALVAGSKAPASGRAASY
jgi:hypothetical protein